MLGLISIENTQGIKYRVYYLGEWAVPNSWSSRVAFVISCM